MKNIFSLFYLILASNLFGQNSKYYVFSEPGLILREEPSINSKKIDIIPSGTLITDITTINNPPITINFKTDNWVRIKYGNQLGYVFKGSLSTFKYPVLTEGFVGNGGYELSYLLKEYLDNNYNKNGNCDTIVIDSSDGPSFHANVIQSYDSNIKLEFHYYWEGSCAILKSTNYNLNDGINLVQILLQKSRRKEAFFTNSLYFKDKNGKVNRVTDGESSYSFYEILFSKEDGLIVKMWFPCC